MICTQSYLVNTKLSYWTCVFIHCLMTSVTQHLKIIWNQCSTISLVSWDHCQTEKSWKEQVTCSILLNGINMRGVLEVDIFWLQKEHVLKYPVQHHCLYWSFYTGELIFLQVYTSTILLFNVIKHMVSTSLGRYFLSTRNDGICMKLKDSLMLGSLKKIQ